MLLATLGYYGSLDVDTNFIISALIVGVFVVIVLGGGLAYFMCCLTIVDLIAWVYGYLRRSMACWEERCAQSGSSSSSYRNDSAIPDSSRSGHSCDQCPWKRCALERTLDCNSARIDDSVNARPGGSSVASNCERDCGGNVERSGAK